MATGKIVRWNAGKGFGWVRIGNREWFVHTTAILPETSRGKDLTGVELEEIQTGNGPKGPAVTFALIKGVERPTPYEYLSGSGIRSLVLEAIISQLRKMGWEAEADYEEYLRPTFLPEGMEGPIKTLVIAQKGRKVVVESPHSIYGQGVAGSLTVSTPDGYKIHWYDWGEGNPVEKVEAVFRGCPDEATHNLLKGVVAERKLSLPSKAYEPGKWVEILMNFAVEQSGEVIKEALSRK